MWRQTGDRSAALFVARASARTGAHALACARPAWAESLCYIAADEWMASTVDAGEGGWALDRTFRTPAANNVGLEALAPAEGGGTVPAGNPATLHWRHPDAGVFYWEVQASPDQLHHGPRQRDCGCLLEPGPWRADNAGA